MQLLDTKLFLKFCKGEIVWNWFKIVPNKQDLHVISFSDCAVTINQPFGVITSPGFPQPYQNGIDCTWNIQLSVGKLIQFNFLHFDIQPGSILGCTWSWRFTAIFKHNQEIYQFRANFFLISFTSYTYTNWLMNGNTAKFSFVIASVNVKTEKIDF